MNYLSLTDKELHELDCILDAALHEACDDLQTIEEFTDLLQVIGNVSTHIEIRKKVKKLHKEMIKGLT